MFGCYGVLLLQQAFRLDLKVTLERYVFRYLDQGGVFLMQNKAITNEHGNISTKTPRNFRSRDFSAISLNVSVALSVYVCSKT